MKDDFSLTFGRAVSGVSEVGVSVWSGRATVMLKGGATPLMDHSGTVLSGFDVSYALTALAAAQCRVCRYYMKCPLISEVVRQRSIMFTK